MNHIYDKDRRVKVLVDGVPVVASPLQSQYAKFLNFTSTDFIATVNPLGYYDLVLKKNADKVIVKKDGSTVETGTANYPNFVNDFNVDEVLGTSTYDITLKYPGRVLTQVAGVVLNTQQRKLNFASGLTATENVVNDTIDIVGSSFTLDPTSTSWKNAGALYGTAGGNSSTSSTIRAGAGMMANWFMENKMVPSMDNTLGPYLDWTTAATSATAVAYSSDPNSASFIRKFNPIFKTQIKIPDISSNRCYFGFADTLPLPNNAFNFLNGANGFGIRFDTGQDTNWQLMYNTGASTNPTPIDTGVAVTANTLYIISIFADEPNSRFGVTINGTTNYLSTVSGAPGQTTPMGFTMRYTTQTGSARHLSFWYLFGQSDK